MEQFYVPFTKADAETGIVGGLMSSGREDSQGEEVDPDAVFAAMPSYMEFGNIREQHDPLKAVGKALWYERRGNGVYLEARIVDPVCKAKLAARVLNGFSLGGRVTKRQGNRITGISLTEVSVVDRPANPDTTFTVWKADGGGGADVTMRSSEEVRKQFERDNADYIARRDRVLKGSVGAESVRIGSAATELLAKAEQAGGLEMAARLNPDLVARLKTEPLPEGLLPTEQLALMEARSGVPMGEILKSDVALSEGYRLEMLNMHPLQEARAASRYAQSRGDYEITKAAMAGVALEEVEVEVNGVVEGDAKRKAAWLSLSRKGAVGGVKFRYRGVLLSPAHLRAIESEVTQ